MFFTDRNGVVLVQRGRAFCVQLHYAKFEPAHGWFRRRNARIDTTVMRSTYLLSALQSSDDDELALLLCIDITVYSLRDEDVDATVGPPAEIHALRKSQACTRTTCSCRRRRAQTRDGKAPKTRGATILLVKNRTNSAATRRKRREKAESMSCRTRT